MYRIGIDLGGTNIVAGVVDDGFRIIGSARVKTNLPRPSEDIVADMARVAREAVAAAGLTMEEIEFVGVGCPGTCNSETGVVAYSNNLEFNNVPVSEKLGAALGKIVTIENDANAAAWGEYVAGAAKGSASCVCVTLGTGVGGGVITDGKILTGFNFAGGELGHTVIVMDGEPCTCGRHGCWEAYASATALIRQTCRAKEAHPDSVMNTIAYTADKVDGRTAFDAMRAGDEAGKQVVNQYIRYIGCGLVNMINIFQPEILCIGGGICKEGETLLAPLREYIRSEHYGEYAGPQTRLCVAQLGNDAGIIGAACLK